MRMHAVLLVAFVCLLKMMQGAPVAQESAALMPAITHIRSGDFYRAVLTLNDVIETLSPDGDQRILARAYAYQAMAFTGLNQVERANAAVRLALTADPTIDADASEFGGRVAALFEAARRGAGGDPEAAGRAAEQAGRYQEAFLAYVTAYQARPRPIPFADDRQLRERIITVARQLATPPSVPQEANEFAAVRPARRCRAGAVDRALADRRTIGLTSARSRQPGKTICPSV